MGWFQRKERPGESTGAKPDRAALETVVRQWIDGLALPCVRLETGQVTQNPRTSFASGHPYSPPGEQWPIISGAPAAFVAQVNFAEAPPTDGIPSAGLLQWFVAANDTLGLTFDETAGSVGFVVRWYDDLSADSQFSPIDSPPAGGVGFAVGPGTELTMAPGRCLPAWNELPHDVRRQDIWKQWAIANGEDAEDTAFVYEEYVRGPSSPDQALVTAHKLGGSASFIQDDPHGTGKYPPSGSPAAALLIELHALGGMGWGDAGIGRLFGDPRAVASGDTRSITYHWDTS